MAKIPPLNLQLIYEGRRPVRAIIDIAALEFLLDAAEDVYDIEQLSKLDRSDLETTPFEDFLRELEARPVEPREGEEEAGGEPSKELPHRHREAG